ncbi:MAG: hypothetical protein ACPIFQ_00785 [Candidatus Puniceispirillaceae bacterium]|jgi:hypothetical protein
MKRRILNRFFAASPLLVTAALLAGCTGDPAYVKCPELTAPEEGTEAFMRIDDTGEIINARLNGVRARCKQVGDDGVSMELSIGLKIKRLNPGDLPAGVAQVNVAALVAEGDKVVSTSPPIRYKAGFKKGQQLIYPVVDHDVTVRQGQRLILSLVPEL